MIPEGWEVYSFSEIASFKNGLNFNSNVENGVPVKIVGVGDFKDRSSLSSFDDLSEVFVPGGVKDELLLKSGDLLFVRSNGNKSLIGRCLYFSEVYERVSFSGFTIRARFDSDYILPEYAAHLSRSSVVTRKFSEEGSGTNISNLSQSILGRVKVPVPPVIEQREIIRTLSAWDEAIAAMGRLIEVEKNKKKSLMQQLIGGKKRLPGFDGKWVKEPMRNLAYLSDRKRDPKNPKSLSDKTECIELEHIDQGTGVLLGSSLTDRSMSQKNFFAKGDVLFGKLRPYLRKFWLSDRSAVCSSEIWVLIPNKEKVCSEYLFLIVQLDKFIESAKKSTGTHMPRADWKVARDTVFEIPEDIEEQMCIAKVIRAADQELDVFQQRLDCLRQEKRALMQQLLTGKRRVKVEEEAVA